MISFYTNTDGAVFFKDDTYLATAFIVIDRPATPDDEAAFPDAFAAFEAALATPVADPDVQP